MLKNFSAAKLLSYTVGIIWRFIPIAVVIDVTMSCVFDYIPLCLHVWKWTLSVDALFILWNSIQKREQWNIHELDIVIAICSRIWVTCTVILHPCMNFWWNFCNETPPSACTEFYFKCDTLLNVELKRERIQTSNYFGVLANMCSVWSTGTVLLPPCMN